MSNPDLPVPAIDHQAALSDYDRYIEEVSIESVTDALDAIARNAEHTDFTENGGARAAAMAVQALRDERPFSLVRIGDGEGNILGALDPDFRNARHFSTRAILEMMFGVADFSAREIQDIAEAMKAAAIGADVLGVSDYIRIGRLQDLRQDPAGRSDIRGYLGSYDSILQLRSLLEQSGRRPPYVVSNYVHRQMMDMYGIIMSAAQRVTIVGPYDRGADICQHFGVKEARVIIIPNQASSSPGLGARWYPTRYNAIRQQLDVGPGHLFLVAAGILGKPLCQEIKSLGGVALDVGSVVDVWIGKAVRNYHTSEFLARYAIAASNPW